MPEEINSDRRRFLGATAMTIAAARLGMLGPVLQQAGCAAGRLPVEGEFPSLAGATQWLNSPPLTAAGLRGKVVLVDFCTYTCVNWLRTLPYRRAWARKYKDQGLILIGAHTPEFSFEHDVDNVRQALKQMVVDYPIAMDNGYAIWRAFDNHYWPALYFIDPAGRIRHHRFGEGEYEESEKIIQRLLAEAGKSDVPDGVVSVDPQGLEVAADWGSLKSPESYVGYERAEGFASAGGAALNESRLYAVPARLERNQWALAGDWTVQREKAVLSKASGRIAFQFHARDLNLIMGPAVRGASVKFRVLIDGKPPGAAHGYDVDEEGKGTLDQQRAYQLIRQPKPIRDRRFDIEFLEPAAEAFCFTFG